MSEVKHKMEEPQPRDSEKHPEEPIAEPIADLTSEEDEYLHGLPLTLMTIALMAGIFMIALDNAILGTTLFSILHNHLQISDLK